jgi:HEAT repeat protein
MPRTALTYSALAALFAAFAATACSDPRSGDAAPTSAAQETRTPAATADEIRRLIAAAGSATSTVREPALAKLASGGDDERKAAEAAIGSDDVALRRGGARALERIAAPESVPALAAALARPSPLEEETLVHTLVFVGTPDAGRALVATALSDDPRRAILAGAALADFAGEFDVSAVRAATAATRAFHVRQAALFALGGHAAPDDRPLFEEASRDAAEPMRAAAVRGLFSLAPVDVADVRRLMLDDAAVMVRQTAAKEALRVHSADVLPCLVAAAAEFDEDVASAAVETLAKRPEPAAFDALLDVVRNDARSAHLRGTAAQRAAFLDRARTVAMLKRESAIFDLETRAYCDEILSPKAGR